MRTPLIIALATFAGGCTIHAHSTHSAHAGTERVEPGAGTTHATHTTRAKPAKAEPARTRRRLGGPAVRWALSTPPSRDTGGTTGTAADSDAAAAAAEKKARRASRKARAKRRAAAKDRAASGTAGTQPGKAANSSTATDRSAPKTGTKTRTIVVVKEGAAPPAKTGGTRVQLVTTPAATSGGPAGKPDAEDENSAAWKAKLAEKERAIAKRKAAVAKGVITRDDNKAGADDKSKLDE